MKKRYVFLLIFVGLVIILIYLGGTFAVKKYNLSNKFGISGNVIDYGVYDNEKELMDKFVEIYAENLKDGEKTYLITGNKEEIKISSYEDISLGEINIISLEKMQKVGVGENKYSLTRITPKNNKVEITINGKTYEFDTKEKENIYLMIKEKIE